MASCHKTPVASLTMSAVWANFRANWVAEWMGDYKQCYLL